MNASWDYYDLAEDHLEGIYEICSANENNADA